MAERYFTAEEANEALATVRPLAEKLVAHRRALREAQERRAELVRSISVIQIQELGVLVKDLDRGLVDFPALRGEEEVLLCWEVGEDEVGYWHGLEEGFAGRRPLPL